METRPGEEGEALELRREAHTALSGRVPAALAVSVALLSGCLLGYGWRAVIARCEHEPAVCPARIPPIVSVVPAGDLCGAAPRVLLIDQKPASPPCPAAEQATKSTETAAAAPPAVEKRPATQ
jgi:hypothetical protein